MIDPRRDRLDYGEQLRPPPGYQFDRAIATTYSADLAAILSIPVALVHAHTLEGDFTGTRPELLHAIRRFSERTLIYHQAGRLHVPAKLNWLYAYLEQTLVPIVPSDAFTSFHPKCWVVRYVPHSDTARASETDARPFYRVIVLSRNLTFDASWDIAATLEGHPEPDVQAANAPMVSFLQWLDSKRGSDHDGDAGFTEFVREFSRVRLSVPPPFREVRFHPMGREMSDASHAPFLDHRADELLVMSPFLHPTTLANLRERSAKLELYSNRHELMRFPVEALPADAIYQLADAIVDADFEETGKETHPTDIPRSLHAKLFVFERGKTLRCFLGSANATEAAVSRNVELVLELVGPSDKVSVRKLRRMLCGDTKSDDPKTPTGPFVPYEPPPHSSANDAFRLLEEKLRRLKHAIISAEITGVAEQETDPAGYTFLISAKLVSVNWPDEFVVSVEPFNVATARMPQRLSPRADQVIRFSNLDEIELSRFLRIQIKHREPTVSDDFLLCLPSVKGLPFDRLDRILRRLLDSPEKFFGYLKFLLADEVSKTDLLASSSMMKQAIESGVRADSLEVPIFEQLLIASSRSPERLHEVDKLIRSLTEARETTGDAPGSPTIISPKFLEFWSVFRRAIDGSSRR